MLGGRSRPHFLTLGLPMAYTLAQYSELQSAIARGVKSVSYNGKTVQYMSLDEMRSILNDMAAELGLNAATPTRMPRRTYTVFDKGLR